MTGVEPVVPVGGTAPGDAAAPGAAAADNEPVGAGSPSEPVNVGTADVAGDEDTDAAEGDTAPGVDGTDGEGTDAEGDQPPAYGDFRMVQVATITIDLPNPHATLVLRELELPRRQLSFAIGLSDATALSHVLRRIPTPRPLTAELLSDILQGFDVDVVAVRLVGSGGVYFAELDLRGRTGRRVYGCRPTDALALALQQPIPAPILVDRRLIEGDGDVAPAPAAY